MADLGRSRKDVLRRATRLGLLLGVVGAAPAGCQEVGSGAVMTSSMYADLSVLGMGDGTSRVRAALRIGSMQSATFVELQPGDTLTAVSGAKTQKLERTADPLGGFYYTGAFTGDLPGTPFTIAFTRQSDVSAPNSQTVLPSQVTHLMPLAGTAVSRSRNFQLSWDVIAGATGDTVDISLTGACIFGLSLLGQPDTGQAVISANQIKADPVDPTATCDMQIIVARKRKGTVDPAFGAGGAFYGIQQSMTTVSCSR